MDYKALNQLLGNIDIYLLDLILKGHYGDDELILDAGCGEGRNMAYFIRQNYHIHGVDMNESAIKMCQFMARSLNKSFDINHIKPGTLENLDYPDDHFHHVICSAVLHFSRDTDHYFQQMTTLSRITKPGGSLFIRMAATNGIEQEVQPLENGVYLLPDQSRRFCITPNLLEKTIESLQLKLLAPPKYVIVDKQRTMSVFLFQKTM